jgi:phosphoribosylformylglycinamidine cyclo-ligase
VDLLLEPHRNYLAAVQELRGRVEVHALAHITGGGLIDNVPRVLPEGLAAEIDRSAWQVPSLFTALQVVGGVNPEEMWRTFNMGIGMIAIVSAEDAKSLHGLAGLSVVTIGRVVASPGGPPRVSLR